MTMTTEAPTHPLPDQPASPTPTSWSARFYARPGLVLGAVLGLTALLVVPFLAMAPTENASTEPDGAVYDARDEIADRLGSNVIANFGILEADGGNVVAAEPMRQLLAAGDALRSDADLGPTLLRYYEDEVDLEAVGWVGLAEVVDAELRADGSGGLDAATDAEVAAVVGELVDRLGERSDVLGLSAQTRGTGAAIVVPAVNIAILSDDEVLGFGATSIGFGGDTAPEEYARELRTVLRDAAPDFQVDLVAIDANLTSEEQGAVAGPFIGFTVLAALLLVGATFRSYWILATVSVAFLLLIIWLKGISNLIGLEEDLVLSLIVPVAMISFGVDFAFHAVGRYREERADGRPAGPAVVVGLGAVASALVLALASDTAAFLANVTSGIESIIQFGIGAAIALVSAFVLLGIVTPFVVAWIEERVPATAPGRGGVIGRVAGGFGAAGLAMTSVLLLVFILPALGVVVTAVTILATLVVPFLRARRRTGPAIGDLPVRGGEAVLAGPVGALVSGIARRPVPVVAVAAVVTAGAATLAVQVPAEFDVEDFFSSDTDFVIGLDQLDVHVGDRGGEPAVLYVEGDLADPAALAVVAARVDDVAGLDTEVLARTDDGDVDIDGGVFAVFDDAFASPVMAGLVAERTGEELTDVDGDGIPDTEAQVRALVAVASETGVPLDAERLLATPDDVRTAIDLPADGDGATAFTLGLVDSRAQESISEARDLLDPIAAELSEELGGSFVQVTGSPFEREASLDATNRALQVSLPVAVLLCLSISALFLRSLRLGVVSVIPILMVVAWLYAVMELAGFAINLVTATIAAVSIGIGIDFAIHFIVRFREELARLGDRHAAVRAAAEGTGVALVASAASSAVGFGILALAPMPLFAAYGLLTAVMILMALVATLVVLPSVLVLVTPSARTAGA